MTHSVRHHDVSSKSPPYATPHTFGAHDSGPREAGAVERPQPLRRRGAPLPAPQLLLAARSSTLANRPTPVKRACENASFTTTPPSSVLRRPTHGSNSSATAASSPPFDDASRQLNRTQRPPPALAPSEGNSASFVSPIKGQQVAREHWHSEQPPAAWATSPLVPTVSREGSASVAQPPHAQRGVGGHPQRVPTSRAPGPSALTGTGPATISTSYPATGSLPPRSPIRNRDGHEGRGDRSENATHHPNSNTPCSATMPSSLPSALFHERQAQAPLLATQSPALRRSAMEVASSGRAAAGSALPSAPAPGKTDAQLDAPKELRSRRCQSATREEGYVAQTAYTQRNPFRSQSFAGFTANPQYRPPPGFDVYPQAVTTRDYGHEVSRASQGDFMMRRLVDAAHPSTLEERAEMEVLLRATLEKLQAGDWFYKWARTNHVHQRYVWLNVQRGTLMWSSSPKKSFGLNSEVKLSAIRSVAPDCLELEVPTRVFYRINISTQDRCISLATEIRKKFDVWYRVLVQLTVPNLAYGEPGVWGRMPRSSNAREWGSTSRWASRYSPLGAITDRAPGAVSSSD
ncbi:hypothetical protein LSCM1_04101 [Leishmania martiniquensis]|uniref:Pleckstrin homology domain-containing protein n=1 Tax=Leishmania martiniquensis TaxID=1580590 RepID=A0A836HGL8_9TRYP|nr:hypothetical protein LSCM1_04101 [Leishmania martiniquensis]